jgi:C-terminal processing protease CtpA/Prc
VNGRTTEYLARNLPEDLISRARDRGPTRRRIWVLVNEHSASAAEMVAGFVAENRLGTISGLRRRAG